MRGIPASRSVWREEAEGTGQGWERGKCWLELWQPPGLPVIPWETESPWKLGPREVVLPTQVAGATGGQQNAGARDQGAWHWAEGTTAMPGGSRGALAERMERQVQDRARRETNYLISVRSLLHTSISTFFF